ncbi:MAG: hypothetical protein H6551_10610 [Chitinophagales bacterium]|nr:hypothetical protein [Chitinophagaceae bacterium]MCB9065580.1 hypothetical protein [Chitinophagales bacterium]
MQRITIQSISLLLLFLCVYSCIQPSDLEPGTNVPFDYELWFNDEVQIPNHNGLDQTITFTINNVSYDNTEDVEVWFEGVPDKIDVIIEPKRIKPTGNVTVTFIDKNIKHGYYPAVLRARSTSGIEKEHSFNFKVLEKTCTKNFSGSYNGPINCIKGSNGTGFLNFTEDRTEKNQLLFWWAGYTRYAKIDCYERTMTFKEQQLGDSTFSGHATYSEDYNTVTMTYIVKHANGNTDSCTTTYTK